jgi:ubiquitin-like protein Pup
VSQQRTRPTRSDNTESGTAAQSSDAHGKELLDQILDEIDSMLAEEDEFLTHFHQRGGE